MICSLCHHPIPDMCQAHYGDDGGPVCTWCLMDNIPVKDHKHKSRKDCVCGGHSASDTKKNLHHHGTRQRFIHRQGKAKGNREIVQPGRSEEAVLKPYELIALSIPVMVDLIGDFDMKRLYDHVGEW